MKPMKRKCRPPHIEHESHEKQILKKLDLILVAIKKCNKPTIDMGFKVGPVTNKEEIKMPLDIQITDEEQVDVTISPKTAAGKPAKVDGVPVWTVKTGDVTLIPTDDGMTCKIVSGLDGDSQVNVEADANLGSGIETISDTVDVHVTSPQATSLGLTAGTPEPKPTT